MNKPVTDPGFNPSKNPGIDAVKRKTLELQAVIEEHAPAGARRDYALMQLEGCSMFAVKAIAVEKERG